jgi:hypothetical protein
MGLVLTVTAQQLALRHLDLTCSCLCVQHLESKAEQRNPDEFYFAMENAKTKDGVHIQRQVQQLCRSTCWTACTLTAQL